MDCPQRMTSWEQSPLSARPEFCRTATPGTVLTQSSPDKDTPDSKNETTAEQPSPFALRGPASQPIMAFHHGVQDPFTTSEPTPLVLSNCARLSATATTFTPSDTSNTPVNRPANSTSHASNLADEHRSSTQSATDIGISNSTTASDDAPKMLAFAGSSPPQRTLDDHGHPSDGVSVDSVCSMGLDFGDLAYHEHFVSLSGKQVTRYLKICNVPRLTGIEDLNKFLNVSLFSSNALILMLYRSPSARVKKRSSCLVLQVTALSLCITRMCVMQRGPHLICT